MIQRRKRQIDPEIEASRPRKHHRQDGSSPSGRSEHLPRVPATNSPHEPQPRRPQSVLDMRAPAERGEQVSHDQCIRSCSFYINNSNAIDKDPVTQMSWHRQAVATSSTPADDRHVHCCCCSVCAIRCWRERRAAMSAARPRSAESRGLHSLTNSSSPACSECPSRLVDANQPLRDICVTACSKATKPQ